MSIGETRTQTERKNRRTETLNKSIKSITEGELQLQDIGSQIAQQQLQSILQQAGFQDLLAGTTGQAFSPQAIADIERRASAAGQLTPEEEALIAKTRDTALASGESDIKRFVTEGISTLKEELAPARGLRPSDTPIVDRGGKIISEAIRQQGQLVRSVDQQANEARLNFPLQRQQFQEQLRNSAFTNRLNLATLTSQSGLQLANTGNFLGSQELLLRERIAQPSESNVVKDKGSGRGAGLETSFNFGNLAGR